ncbi:hypothetical protein D3C83_122570 [compost metagenome]
MISSMFDTTACEISMPVAGEMPPNSTLRKIGISTMKPAPRNEPRIDPTPPMMTMNRTRKERSSVKASGSTVPR